MGTAVVPRPQGAQGEFCNSLAANQTPTGGLPSLPRGGALACKAALEGCCLHGKGLSPRQPRVPTTHQEGSPPQRKLKRKLHYTETCVTNANPSHLGDKSSLIVFPNQAHTHTHTHTHTPLGNFLTLGTHFFLALSGTEEPELRLKNYILTETIYEKPIT